MSAELELLLAERAIQRVLCTYSRSVDQFGRRQGEWRIKTRVCAYEWGRTYRVDGDGGFADTYVRGVGSPDDVVYRDLGR